MGKAQPVHPDGLNADLCTGLSDPRLLVGKSSRRSVPITWRWARFAACLLPGRRGFEVRVEWPQPWAQLAGRSLCPSYKCQHTPSVPL